MARAHARSVSVILLALGLAPEAGATPVPPELGGHLIVATSSVTGRDDLRLGRIAAGFARKGFESYVAYDLAKPPADAERLIERARWHVDEARRLRRKGRIDSAVFNADAAVRHLERAATEPVHLGLLVEALTERGTVAVTEKDAAAAETLFLRAIALDPVYDPEAALFSDEAVTLYNEVRRVSRQLSYGVLRVDPAGAESPSVFIDFSGPKEPPYEAKLPHGLHYVSISAPGRRDVVTSVLVRADRQTLVTVRPPLPGSDEVREAALAALRPDDPASIVALASAASLRFVVLVEIGRSILTLRSYDGRTGASLAGGEAQISIRPSDDEVDAAVGLLTAAAVSSDPRLAPPADEGSPLWPWALAGIALAGAGAVTAFLLLGDSTATYRFTPPD